MTLFKLASAFCFLTALSACGPQPGGPTPVVQGANGGMGNGGGVTAGGGVAVH